MAWQRKLAAGPQSWWPIVVTGFFRATVNFGSTTMALAGGGVGRTSVLVFTMPFWTLLIAWPVLGERVRGAQWFAVGFALAGLVLVVEPWRWEGELAPKLWAVLSGFGWAAGTVATKYFQRALPPRHAEFPRVADARRRAAADSAAVAACDSRRRAGMRQYVALLAWTARGLDRARLPGVDRRYCAFCPPAPRRSTCSRSR